MRVPLSWISEFAPFGEDASALGAQLDDLGLVVEAIEHVGEGLESVVVARVEEISSIEGADRIRRVLVDAGSDTPVEVVCGAWNFSVGDLVALAKVGAVLPGGFEIARRKMRGVTSDGMLCSSRELKLGEDQQGIMVLDGAGAMSPGTPLVDALGIERDVVFDIAVEANRPDAWSMAGIARDLAARLGLPFTEPAEPPATVGLRSQGPTPLGPIPAGDLVTLEVRDGDLCPRFTLHVLEGVEVAPSPKWVSRRLALAGMRPVNNVVDASNYVMLELGQPTHPYDLDALGSESPGLVVRAARAGEEITTLDGTVRQLGSRPVGPADDRRDCIICDAAGTPVGIGGVMGAALSEIAPGTTRVLIEAAYFTPMAIARTAQRLKLRTEASARFERGCDPGGIDRAVARFCEILTESAGPALRLAPGKVEYSGDVPRPLLVEVRTARVNLLLGTDLEDETVASYLEPIGFRCRVRDPGLVEVTVPTSRPDSTREIDVVEEIARHHGYSRLPRRQVRPLQVGRLDLHQRRRRTARSVVAGLGIDEAWTASLLAPGDHERCGLGSGGIAVSNPLTPDESILRRDLMPGLLKALAFNFDRRQREVRLFEVGNVFDPPGPDRLEEAARRKGATVVDEREHLAVALGGPEDDAASAMRAWLVLAEALGISEVSLQADRGDPAPGLHPTRSARLVLGAGSLAPSVLGAVGEIAPNVLEAHHISRRVGWIWVDLGLVLGLPRRDDKVRPVSQYPSSDIDLAFVVQDAVPASRVEATLRDSGGDLLEHVYLFDVYRGPGVAPSSRSLAYSLRLCALDHTLTTDEISETRLRLIDAVEKTHGATLRA